MKLAVIVADASDCIGAGLDVQRTVKLFALSPEAVAYIAAAKAVTYCTVTLALEDTQ